MRQNNPARVAEFGGMMLYILVGVVLFGMLIYTYTKSGNVSSSVAGKGKAKTIAMQILEDSNTIAQRTEKLMAKGCAPSQLQYDDWTINSTSPSDKSCHVFLDSNNGGIRVPSPPIGFNAATPWWGLRYVFAGKISLPDQGTSCDEFFLSLYDVDKNICSEINKILGVNYIPDVGGAWHNGGFIAPNATCESWANWGDTGEPTLVKSNHVCFKYNTRYVYTRMLIAR